MAKQISMYKLGVVLDVQGTKGLNTLKATDAELTKVDKSGKRAEGTISRFAGALNRVSSALKGNAGGAGDGGWLPGLAHVSNVIQAIPQIGQLAGALVSPLTNAAQSGVRFNAFLETTEIALKRHFGGSREMARGFVNEVRSFAQSSPFRTEGLIKTIIYGTATGFSPRDALALVKDVGDAIASTGDISEETVEGVVRALSQMKAKGTVSAEEMEQLAERGIPAWEMLANSIGKTVAQTRKLSEQGRLNGPAAVAALRAEMRARYGGMMEELESTFVGRQSALEDKLQEAQAAGTQTLFNDLSASFEFALHNSKLATDLAKSVDAMIKPASALIKASARTMMGGSLTEGLAAGIELGTGLVSQATISLSLDGILKPFDSFWQRNSPSKVMMGRGHDLTMGLVLGMQDGARQFRTVRFDDEIERLIEENAERAGIDPNLLRALIKQESGGKRGAVSHKGARGLMQLMPATAARFGVRNIHDPAQNIRGGTDYLAWLLKRFGGNVPLALAGYNAGEGAVDKYKGIPPYRETQNYVRSIMSAYNRQQELSGESSGSQPQPARRGFVSRIDEGVYFVSAGGEVFQLMSQWPSGTQGVGMPQQLRTRIGSLSDLPGLAAQMGGMTNARVLAAEYEGLRDRGGAEHGGRYADLGRPLIKVPIYENGRIIGYDAHDPSEGGGSFSPGAAPSVIARAQRESAEILPIFNTQLREQVNLMPMLNQEIDTLGRYLPKLSLATERQELAAGHAAASVIQLAKSAESTGEKLVGMIGGLSGMLPSGGQQTGKRGFFSKLLGAAAPFLSFVPGVGPLLSTLAGMGSSALAGDWGGVLSGAVSGFAPGGAFRGAGGGGRAPLPTSDHSGLNGVSLTPPGGSLPGRAMGGPVRRGRAYVVGEHREEVVEFGADGYVHPSIESYLARRGGGGGVSAGGWGAMLGPMLEQIAAQLERNATSLDRFESMPADHVVMTGTKSAAAQRAVADAYMSHAGRDPSAIEWMTRRVAPQ